MVILPVKPYSSRSRSNIPVLEVTGPDPASRRAKGKDDALDAISAAEAARTRRRVQVAKDRSGTVEALRVLRTTRKTAIKCRRAALQQLHNTIVAAPEEVRDQVRNLTRMQRLRTCAAWRPDTVGYRDPVVATKLSLKSLARRILDINDEIAELDRFIVLSLLLIPSGAETQVFWAQPATGFTGCADEAR